MFRPHQYSIGLALLLACGIVRLNAQAVISVKAGLVHYTEGSVYLADDAVRAKAGEYPQMKDGDVLSTAAGRTEVLLAPGVFLRLAENSSVKMVSDRLEDTRLEFLTGSVLVEAAEITKGSSVTVAYKNAVVELRKRGLIRLDAGMDRLRVYDGEAIVMAGGQTVTLKDGKQAQLNGVLAPEKFDDKIGDAFYRWAGRRAGYLAVANLSAAKYARDSSANFAANAWRFNPYFGTYTFIPRNGLYHSHFGAAYYSPRAVYRVYEPPAPLPMHDMGGFDSGPRYNPSLGYSTAPRSAPSGQASAGGGGAPAASPAPSPRSSDSGSPRQSGGRGR